MDFKKYGIFKEKGRKYENIGYVMALIYNICEKKVEKILTKYNLTLTKFNTLLVVRYQSNTNGITQVEISKHLIVTPSNITKIMTSLSSEGLIEIDQNKKNRRENLVKITKSGEDLIEKIWPEYDKTVGELVNLIPQEKQDELASILANWFIKLEKI